MFKKNNSPDVVFSTTLDVVLLNVEFLEDGYSKVVVYYVLHNIKKQQCRHIYRTFLKTSTCIFTNEKGINYRILCVILQFENYIISFLFVLMAWL